MKKILVILSPGFEETEAITVVDVLRRAKLDVTTASLENNQTVLGSHSIAVIADVSLSDILSWAADTFDAIVLPGGMRGVENMLDDQRVIELVSSFAAQNKVTAAVCAGPLILEKAGVLAEDSFTCHPCIFDRITSSNRLEKAAVVDRNVVTGRSAGCALAWALELAKILTPHADAIFPGLAFID